MKGARGAWPGGIKEQQRRLAEEVAEEREILLQACWAHQIWRTRELKTDDARRLEVIATGWLNRGAGPDFTEARILIDGEEHWGDVEIHVDEGDWWGHGHQNDSNYERVILHMVLRRGNRLAERPPGGLVLPVFDASPYLSEQVLVSMHEPEEMLRRYERLPGRCGLRAAISDPETVNRVIAHAAEARARGKAERIAPLIEELGEEQALFVVLFKYLGYRPHAGLFERIARHVPLDSLWPGLDQSLPEARMSVMSLWFGLAGLLEEELPPSADEGARREHERLRTLWKSSGRHSLTQGISRGGSRPFNAPERRMLGFFHHLYAWSSQGWLKSWLGVLRELDTLRDHPEFRREAISMLEAAFSTPGDEPWRKRVGFHSPPLARPAALIGPDRIIMVMANAVLPFFLAMARRKGDSELEKVLYRLYIVLPPEGSNQKIRFMERRLAGIRPLKPTLRTHQGLLQIHQDFCSSFLEGCEQCRFPDLIAPSQTRAGFPNTGHAES